MPVKAWLIFHCRSGSTTIVAVDRDPLVLLAVSRRFEPIPVLRMQLSLVYYQIESVLTRSALVAVFNKAPGYDLRRLLGVLEGGGGTWRSGSRALALRDAT